jgi:hypothetical protein
VLAVWSAESDVAQRGRCIAHYGRGDIGRHPRRMFRQAGVMGVDSVSELVDVFAAVTWQPCRPVTGWQG